MNAVDEFIDECRREWERLGVPRRVIDVLAREVATDLEAAGATDRIPGQVLGRDASDPRAFAESWARERGAIRPRWQASQGRPSLRTGVLVLVLLLVLGGIAGVLEFMSPSEQESRSNTPTSSTGTQTTEAPVAVPDMLGLSRDAAVKAAQDAGLRVGTVSVRTGPTNPPGTVFQQAPAAGTRVEHGSAVSLVVTK